jgi:23S rRNA (cytosine1962-C5)-methyltransferase
MDAPAGEIVQLVSDRPIAWGLADDGPIAVRVLGRGKAPSDPVAEIERRIAVADAARPRFLAPETDAYRVVGGEGDGLGGLVVDRYGSLAVVRLYGACWVPNLERITAAVARFPWVSTVARRLGVARVDAREGLETLSGPTAPERLVVSEGGMRLLVRPYVGQKTGLFLDQREHRALVRRWTGDVGVVANLFAYNGGFSIAAALGGARRVFTVDLAPEAVADARENFSLNGLDPDRHAFVVADAFAWRPEQPVDVLVVDPPSLAHARANEAAARQAYQKLHERLSPFVADNGLLATSSCTARLTMSAWKQSVKDGLRGDWSWVWQSSEPPDHPVAVAHSEGHYLKFGVLRRRGAPPG